MTYEYVLPNLLPSCDILNHEPDPVIGHYSSFKALNMSQLDLRYDDRAPAKVTPTERGTETCKKVVWNFDLIPVYQYPHDICKESASIPTPILRPSNALAMQGNTSTPLPRCIPQGPTSA